jgi:atypical dual specificity phosphatase
MFIDVPYWTQLATDAVYSLEQVLESKIIGDHKENSNPSTNGESWMRNLSDQVIFHVSLGYNLANHHQVSQPWWTEIPEKKIILGALPFHERKHVERLKSLGVGGVLTLNKPFELQPNLIGTPVQPCDWLLNNVESLHIPTPDFCPPTPEEIKLGIEFMKKIISSGKSVYVHCKAGRGRSVVAVVCYLLEVDNMTVEEAVDYVKKRRPQINMGKIQLNICYSYYNLLHGIQTETTKEECDQEELLKQCQEDCEGLEDDSLVQDINDEFYLV